MASMTISKLAGAVGVGVETVRFYQRLGLLERPAVAHGSMRTPTRYDESHVQRLAFIRSAKSAGFTLAEIGELLRLDAGDNRARVRELADERIAALDRSIGELQRARTALVRLNDECKSSSRGPCPIIAAFAEG